MKQIKSNIGGRFRYNEDFRAIQEAALALSEFLKSSNENFVISGCENGDGGYVWLDGKIRYVEESDKDSDFIICKDTDGPSVLYGDDTSHKLYTEYGASYSDSPNGTYISKENGKFPSIRGKFWEHIGIAKNSGAKQNITSNVNFNNGVELKTINLQYGCVKISNTEICFESKNGDGFSLFTDKPMVGIRKGGETVSVFGGDVYQDDLFGEVLMPTLNGTSMRVLEKANASKYNVEGKDIKDLLKTPMHIQKTSWLPFVDTKNNTQYKNIGAKRIKDKIFIRGRLEVKYILNGLDETNFDDLIDYDKLLQSNEYVEEVNSFNAKSLDENSKVVEHGKIARLKLKLKLPDEIPVPDEDILPGCMIMSLYPENYLNQNAKATDYYSLGNAQLQLGSDGFLYLVIGTGFKMYFGGRSIYINFNYIV